MESIINEKCKGTLFGTRHGQVLLLFLLLVNVGCLRSNLNFTIVAMTTTNSSSNPEIPVYNWTNTGVILSSFYWGYSVVQFFTGQLAYQYGAKWFLFGGCMIAGLTGVLLPYMASLLGSTGVIICRVVEGIVEGACVPIFQIFIGNWVVDTERTWTMGSIYMGVYLGIFINTALSGYLSSSWIGWPSTFYLVGTLCFVWCVFFAKFGFSSPATHPSISKQEKELIEMSLGQHGQKEHVNTPWGNIVTSVPVWAIVLAGIGESWGNTTLQTNTPTYLAKVANMDLKLNGLVSSAPSAAALVLGFSYGPLSDYLIAKKYCSRLTMRKVFHGIASFIPALTLSLMTFVDDQVLIAVLFIVSSAVFPAFTCSYIINTLDISPRFGGIIFGIANGTGQTIAIIAPLFVQFVVSDEIDRTQWRTVFILTSAVFAITAVIFITFATADRQAWDSGPIKKKNENRERIEVKHFAPTTLRNLSA